MNDPMPFDQFRSHFNAMLRWIGTKGDCIEAERERDILFAAYQAALDRRLTSSPEGATLPPGHEERP